ncbi:MAG: restriction endonuclease subunit S [Cyclobacteriaceae bacterium]
MHEWTVYRLGDISDSCLGKMLDKKKNKGEFQPYLSNKCVRWGSFDFEYLSEMKFEEHESKRYGLIYGDLIICEGGEPGRCAIWKDEVPNMKIQKALHRLRVHNEFSNEFLYYRFLLAGRTKGLDKYFIGSTIKHLTGVSLKGIEFSFPYFNEQKAIAKVLSDLDAKITLNNRINQELEAMAKLIYDYWFVQFDFPISAEQAAAMGRPDLKGKPYKSSGGKMVYNEQLKRAIPEGWEDGTLNDFGEIIGGSTPSKAEEKNFSNKGTPWITPKDLSINSGKKYITKGEVDVSAIGLKSASLKIMPPGTVLMSSRAPVGYLAIAREKVTTNQGFKSFVPNKGYSTEYIFHTLMRAMSLIEANASGSTFREVSTSVLRNLNWSKPTIEFVENYTKIISPLFNKQDILEQENQKLSELRDWLLPMLMNGQVKVSETGFSGLEDGQDFNMAAEPSEKYGEQ